VSGDGQYRSHAAFGNTRRYKAAGRLATTGRQMLPEAALQPRGAPARQDYGRPTIVLVTDFTPLALHAMLSAGSSRSRSWRSRSTHRHSGLTLMAAVVDGFVLDHWPCRRVIARIA
jgi:hypothetical protein